MEFKGTCLACGPADLTATETQGKRSSVYVRCEDCQSQTFIRTRKGIRAFTEKHGDGWRAAPSTTSSKGETDGEKAERPGKGTKAGRGADAAGRTAGPLDF